MDKRTLTTGLWVALLLMAITCGVGCIPKAGIHGIKPKRTPLSKIRTLAILEFRGSYGETLRTHIYDRLAKTQRSWPMNTPSYPCSGKVIHEQLEDAEFSTGLEARIEADAVITGRVIATVRDTYGTDQVLVKEGTGHHKRGKTPDGQWADVEIKRTVIRMLPYVIRKASLTTEYKIIDPKSKRDMASGRLTESCEQKFGGDKEYTSFDYKLSDLPSQSYTIDELSTRLAGNLVAELSLTKLSGVVKLD